MSVSDSKADRNALRGLREAVSQQIEELHRLREAIRPRRNELDRLFDAQMRTGGERIPAWSWGVFERLGLSLGRRRRIWSLLNRQRRELEERWRMYEEQAAEAASREEPPP